MDIGGKGVWMKGELGCGWWGKGGVNDGGEGVWMMADRGCVDELGIGVWMMGERGCG